MCGINWGWIHWLGFTVDLKCKNKIFKLWKADDSTAIIQLDPKTRIKTKPRYESRKIGRVKISLKIRPKIVELF